MASQASPTDDTEKYAKEKMQDLQIVKVLVNFMEFSTDKMGEIVCRSGDT